MDYFSVPAPDLRKLLEHMIGYEKDSCVPDQHCVQYALSDFHMCSTESTVFQLVRDPLESDERYNARKQYFKEYITLKELEELAEARFDLDFLRNNPVILVSARKAVNQQSSFYARLSEDFSKTNENKN